MRRVVGLVVCLIWLTGSPPPSHAAQASAYEHSLIGVVMAVTGVKITQAAARNSRSPGNLLTLQALDRLWRGLEVKN